MLKQLAPGSMEIALVEKIVKDMPLNYKLSYDKYLNSIGFLSSHIDFYAATETLHKRGWLLKPSDIYEQHPVYLTKEAWDRYSLKEWADVEEEFKETLRGEDSGSW